MVYKAIDKRNGELVAIKHIDLEGSDDDIREIQQEISLLSTCSSDYVTRYKSSFVRGTKLWIVMEYLGGGSCLDLLKPGPFSEVHISIVMKELLLGLQYLHETGKIHRDIKAANVLLSEAGRVKIADFGVAAQLTNIKSQRLTFVGTPFWMAPEVIQEAGYDFRADIWSLGITAMELALGEPPNSNVHPMKVLFLIPKEKPPRLEGSQWSRDFKDFVAACLVKEAEKRPTAKALLKHRFIAKAGKVEMLKELVDRAQRFDANGGHSERNTRYYEETLRDANMDEGDDEWVFDTIKPATVRQQQLAKHTIKRRKLSRIPSNDGTDNAAEMMQQMDLNAAPLGNITNSPSTSPSKNSSTIRTPKPATDSQRRRVSALTTRKVSVSTPTARRVSRQVSGSTPTARRVSGQPKQPLGLDMSFGNGTSTVRQFKRVSSGHVQSSPPQQPSVEEVQVFDSDVENQPPRQQQPKAAAPVTKEAVLGRRVYVKAIGPAFQEAYAATGDRTKREQMAKVAEAWSKFDELDPEGELLLLKGMMDRIQNDPKLAAQLLPQRVANAQLASLRMSSPQKKAMVSIHEHDMGSRDVTPQSSPTKSKASPEKRDGTPKLVLNPQNPHLKKMRSKQHLQEEKEKSLLDEKMPGRSEQGMEHVSMLSDVLYGRWAEGLKARWPLA